MAALAAALLVLLASAGAASAFGGGTLLVSQLAGAGGDGHSFDASVSSDGRFVAFTSKADNLSADDYDDVNNVYVRDMLTGAVTLVSRASGFDGEGGWDDSWEPSISADGRLVAFSSSAANLQAGHFSGTFDIFVRDIAAGTTTLVSVAANGPANDSSRNPAISGNGKFVAFESDADNLFPEDQNRTSRETDVFVTSTQPGGFMTLVSRANSGVPGDDDSSNAAISHDGRFVAFESEADNLSTADSDVHRDVFVRGEGGVVRLVSLGNETHSGVGFTPPANGDSFNPSVSAEGSVAYESLASNLVPGDLNKTMDVFVGDRTGKSVLVSRAHGVSGAVGDGASLDASISQQGRFVAFVSFAANLSAQHVPGATDVFVRDLLTGGTTLASRAVGGTGSSAPSISGDGLNLAYHSDAENLSDVDVDDGVLDVFRNALSPVVPPLRPQPGPGGPVIGGF